VLGTALKLAARGLHVFPCVPSSKQPACTHGCLDATGDVIAIHAWWRENPAYNIGVATGAPSDVFVVDVDGGEAETALARLEAEHGTLPPTVEAITPRPGTGRHLFFRMPPEGDVRNSIDKFNGASIHVRGTGGYVVMPPSIHPSGFRYRWSVDSANAFAAAPQWLLDKITEPKNGNGKAATPPSEWRELVNNGVEEGQRDHQLTRLTGHLLRRYIDPFVTQQLVMSWNVTHCRPPLPPEDIERIVNSIAGRELRRRGGG
jgi:hypothetical protein